MLFALQSQKIFFAAETVSSGVTFCSLLFHLRRYYLLLTVEIVSSGVTSLLLCVRLSLLSEPSFSALRCFRTFTLLFFLSSLVRCSSAVEVFFCFSRSLLFLSVVHAVEQVFPR